PAYGAEPTTLPGSECVRSARLPPVRPPRAVGSHCRIRQTRQEEREVKGMRYLVGLILVGGVLLALAACGGSGTKSIGGCKIEVNTSCPNADFRGSDLSNQDLTSADLSGADFTNADLSGANLTEANLTNSRVINANME